MQGRHANRLGLARLASLAAAVACAALAALAPLRGAEAVPSGTVTMSPSAIYINPGDAVAVTVIMNSGVDIHEVNFALAYNPAVVQVVDAMAGQSGTQVLQGPFPAAPSAGTMLQNNAAAGTIAYQYALPPGFMDVGFGTVFTAQFVALAEGDAGLSWQMIQVVDAAGAPASLAGSAASLIVGAGTPTPAATDTPSATGTPTSTPVDQATETPTATPTGETSATATATPEETVTGTATSTRTPAATTTPKATATPKITVVDDTNQGRPPQSGVDPAQSDRAGGLPSAGIARHGIAWWRWVFFLAALLFGVAGWFFTLAVYNNSKEVVLIDRFDKRRRRR